MSRVRPDLNYASTTYGPPRGSRRPRRPISPAVRRYLDRKLRKQRKLFNRSNRRYNRGQRQMSPEMRSRIEELRRRQQEQIMRSRDTIVGGTRPKLQKAIIEGTPEYAAQQQKIANMPQELKDLQAAIFERNRAYHKQRMQDPAFIAFNNKQRDFQQRLMSRPEYQELQVAAMMAQRQGKTFVPTEAQKRIQQKMRMEQHLFQRQMQQDPYFAKMQTDDAAFRKANQQQDQLYSTRIQEYLNPSQPPKSTNIVRRKAPTGGRKLPAGWKIDPTTGKPTGGHRRPPRRDPRPSGKDVNVPTAADAVQTSPATPGPSAPVQTGLAKRRDIPQKPTVESQMKDLLGPKASNALAKNQVIYGKSPQLDPQNEPAWVKGAREKAKNLNLPNRGMGPP